MKISISFGAAVLTLSVVAASCTTVSGASERSGRVYLVGVAGGG